MIAPLPLWHYPAAEFMCNWALCIFPEMGISNFGIEAEYVWCTLVQVWIFASRMSVTLASRTFLVQNQTFRI